ncbi:choice-of-anchor A family protein [Microbacterium resistens]
MPLAPKALITAVSAAAISALGLGIAAPSPTAEDTPRLSGQNGAESPSPAPFIGQCTIGELPSPDNRNRRVVDNNVAVYAGSDLILTGNRAEVEGLVVVGRDLHVAPDRARRIDLGVVGVGSHVTPGGGRPALAVGGDLSVTTRGTLGVAGGPVRVGGALSPGFPSSAYDFRSGVQDEMGSAATAAWASYGDLLRRTSADYAQLPTTGTVMHGVNFEGTGAAREVFALKADQLPDEIEFTEIADDATVIVNIHGATANWAPYQFSEDGARMDVVGQGVSGFGRVAQRTIWNFVDATQVTLGGSSEILGSILVPGVGADPSRPTVDVTASTNGRLLTNGTLRLAGEGAEHHNYPFVEEPFECNPDPEPPVDPGPPVDPEPPTDPDPATSTVLTLRKDVITRADAADQFRLTIAPAHDAERPVAEATSSGDRPGRQQAQAGAVPVAPGEEYTLSEVGTGSRGLDAYDATWLCRDEDTGETLAEGDGSAFTLTIPTQQPGADRALECVFTNSPRPDVTVTKRATPDSGTAVVPGQRVEYTLHFQNPAGVPVDVDHTDLLSDVLDDAILGPDPIRADAPLVAELDRDRLRVSGRLPAAASADVHYSVTVKDADALGDRVLRNLVIRTGTETPDCEDAVACTENPVEVPAWTVSKTADPVAGGEVFPGDAVDYTVTATGVHGIVPDARLTDDLSDVLASADFVAGSATLTIGDAAPLRVADPADGVLATAAFPVSAGQEAVLRYRVIVHEDAWARTLRNVAWGHSSTPPDTCTPEAPCETAHHTPARAPELPQTGGTGTATFTVAGLVLLTVLTGIILARRAGRHRG